jgi:hypothetical protein
MNPSLFIYIFLAFYSFYGQIIWLNLPLQQAPEKVKAIAIALQLPHPPRRAILPAQLLSEQQPIVPRNALDASPRASFLLEGDDLVHVQPVRIIHILEALVEADAQEADVQFFERSQDSRKQFLDDDGA